MATSNGHPATPSFFLIGSRGFYDSSNRLPSIPSAVTDDAVLASSSRAPVVGEPRESEVEIGFDSVASWKGDGREDYCFHVLRGFMYKFEVGEESTAYALRCR